MDELAKQRPTKQVIVIRRDLRMRRGKEIAQGAHASTAWLAERVIQGMNAVGSIELSEAERAWLDSSFRKVTVKVGSEAELLAPTPGARGAQAAHRRRLARPGRGRRRIRGPGAPDPVVPALLRGHSGRLPVRGAQRTRIRPGE